MGGLNVKNTMVECGLQIVAPHPCYGCGKVGEILCSHCKYDIIHEPFVGCFVCAAPQKDGICTKHGSPLERAFIVSTRSGTLEDAINGLKFSGMKAGARVMAELLDASLPYLPEGTTIVPIPTVRSHIRQRGYDQVELIARQFALLRGLTVASVLVRTNKATQHTVGRAERKVQATAAFKVREAALEGLGEGPMLILDDIVTTGATLLAAGEALVGAKQPLWTAALAYQPLD